MLLTSANRTGSAPIRRRRATDLIQVDFTAQELDLLASLAADQLFRKEFIDSKMPGSKSDPGQIGLGKALVVRLRGLSARHSGRILPPTRLGK